jgi:hypothetical protein
MAGKIVVDTLQIDATTSSFQVLGNTGSLIFSMTSNGNAVVNTNSVGNAFRITQTGTGNALVVEDSANPDATPFVVDANGSVIVGHTSPIGAGQNTNIQSHSIGGSAGISAFRWSDDTIPPRIQIGKSRGASVGTNAIVQSGDQLGGVYFYGDDGTDLVTQGASIIAEVDGTPGTNDMPGRLVFRTTADGASFTSEKMRIDSTGNVSIGTADLGSSVDTRQLLVASNGYAVIRVNGDYNNLGGEPGGSAVVLSAEGTSVRNAIFSFVNIANTSGDSAATYNGTIGNSILVGTAAAQPLQFGTNSEVRATITSDGKVGIGTTTPSFGLDIFSSSRFDSSIALTCTDAGASAGPFLELFRLSASPAVNDVLGAMYFEGNNSLANIITYAAIESVITNVTSGAESGALLFKTASAGVYDESGRISATGGYVLRGGVASPGGIGITFPATQSASSDANTLDDYEEGTWTPVVADNTAGGNAGSATITNANYTKIGRQVTATAVLTNIITTSMVGANTFYVRGFPFTSSSVHQSEGSVRTDTVTFPTNRTYFTATMGSSDTWINFTGSGSGVADSALNVASVLSGSADLAFSITYFV